MQTLNAGGRVQMLRFLPDGRRVLAGVSDVEQSRVTADVPVRFVVLPLAGGEPVTLDLPDLPLKAWWYLAHYGPAVSVHPSGDRVWIAWENRLYCRSTADGRPLPTPDRMPGVQAVVSADGGVLVSYGLVEGRRHLVAATTNPPDRELWRRSVGENFRQLAGLLPGTNAVVTIDDRVRVRYFSDDAEIASARFPGNRTDRPTNSPDGRYLAANSHSSLYLFDLTDLGKPRQIKSSRTTGDFRGSAFHPDGRRLAVIHGGPTLLKLYDLETLEQTGKYKWKVGRLTEVAFSPDGQLGAVGTEDGRVLVWDVEE